MGLVVGEAYKAVRTNRWLFALMDERCDDQRKVLEPYTLKKATTVATKVIRAYADKSHTLSVEKDEHGISTQEFYEDPDFAEDYMRGLYDVTCYHCGGLRVVDVVDEERLTPAEKEAWEKWVDDEYAYRAEVEAERRMGC